MNSNFLTIAPFGSWHKLLAIFTLLNLSGCYYYEDIEVFVTKTIFYPNDNVVVYVNSVTGEKKTLQTDHYVCHDTPKLDFYYTYNYYKRYWPELCGQSAKVSSSGSDWFDRMISSESMPYAEIYQVSFEDYYFPLRIGSMPTNNARLLDSIYINNNLHSPINILSARKRNGSSLHFQV